MQTINLFYYNNTVEVQLNIDPTLTLRNKVVYQRTLKLYKGVDNVIRFVFKNSDQKPVNLTGFDITFNIVDNETGSLLITKAGTIVNATGGVVTVPLTEFDTLNLQHDWYNYTVLATDPLTGTQHVIYTDDNYEAEGQIHLIPNAYPTFHPSINVQLPTNSNTSVTTSTLTADSVALQASAHHTAQFYFTNFSGHIDVQGTLDVLPPNGTTSGNTSVSWGSVGILTYTNQNTTDYANWNGVYTAVRFVITPIIGAVDKILYRT
jgi:hypothetical protein